MKLGAAKIFIKVRPGEKFISGRLNCRRSVFCCRELQVHYPRPAVDEKYPIRTPGDLEIVRTERRLDVGYDEAGAHVAFEFLISRNTVNDLGIKRGAFESAFIDVLTGEMSGPASNASPFQNVRGDGGEVIKIRAFQNVSYAIVNLAADPIDLLVFKEDKFIPRH